MTRTSLPRRFAPLVAVLAGQFLLILVTPSVGRQPAHFVAGANATGAPGLGSEAAGSVAADGSTPAATPGSQGQTGLSRQAAHGTTALGTTHLTPPPGAVGGGDTSHCVAGREFDPAIAYYAPPCVPGMPGGRFQHNGGATAQGVTADAITVVRYFPQKDPQTQALNKTAGEDYTIDQDRAWNDGMARFINTHYVLYGRKLRIVTVQGQCSTNPPDDSCAIPEVDRIVDTYHPFAVTGALGCAGTSCVAELARRHTVAFPTIAVASDDFANASAPYYYNTNESSDRIANAFAQWWCAQASSANVPSRTVRYAANVNPRQNLNGQPRRLGVVAPNDADDKRTVFKVLGAALHQQCGDRIWQTYFYDSNLNTVAQQQAASMARMDTPSDPVTAILCFCGAGATPFIYQAEQNANYYPENVIATNSFVDDDNIGQFIEKVCGPPSCPFDGVFGLGTAPAAEPNTNNEGIRMYRAGGGGTPPISAGAANAGGRRLAMMANLIENAGPDLTPETMAARAPLLPAVGGGTTGQPLLALTPGNWFWTQDARVIYWDKHRPSKYNGQPGSYVQIGSRVNLGQFPFLPGGITMPYPRN